MLKLLFTYNVCDSITNPGSVAKKQQNKCKYHFTILFNTDVPRRLSEHSNFETKTLDFKQISRPHTM